MTSETTRRARPVVGAVVGILVAVFVVGFAVVLVQSFATVKAIRESQKTNTSTNQTILDCTEPTGECYKESQRRTKEVVTDIGKVSAYAAACADLPGVQGSDEVLTCVLDRLAADDRAPK